MKHLVERSDAESASWFAGGQDEGTDISSRLNPPAREFAKLYYIRRDRVVEKQPSLVNACKGRPILEEEASVLLLHVCIVEKWAREPVASTCVTPLAVPVKSKRRANLDSPGIWNSSHMTWKDCNNLCMSS